MEFGAAGWEYHDDHATTTSLVEYVLFEADFYDTRPMQLELNTSPLIKARITAGNYPQVLPIHMKSEKFAVSSIKRSIADRTAPIPSSKKPLKTTVQSVVDVRAMKPSLANTSGLNNVGDALAEDGWAFEDRCAQILSAKSWKVEVTPGSGDYGVDLIAQKGIYTVAIQCKRWSSAVGNKAVQEAFAGRGYYSTTHAAVVSISGYTKAARLQAERLNVVLLDLDELARLSVLLA